MTQVSNYIDSTRSFIECLNEALPHSALADDRRILQFETPIYHSSALREQLLEAITRNIIDLNTPSFDWRHSAIQEDVGRANPVVDDIQFRLEIYDNHYRVVAKIILSTNISYIRLKVTRDELSGVVRRATQELLCNKELFHGLSTEDLPVLHLYSPFMERGALITEIRLRSGDVLTSVRASIVEFGYDDYHDPLADFFVGEVENDNTALQFLLIEELRKVGLNRLANRTLVSLL